MDGLNSLDCKLLFELLKNSNRSDRELAKVLNSSQPTITRRRRRLEKEAIDGYTAIPKWEKIGYGLLAIILVKSTSIFGLKKYAELREEGINWLMAQHNIIMGGACEGMGINYFVISVHKDYSEYNKFMLKLRLEMREFVDDVHSILVDLRATKRMKPFHLKYLAKGK